MNEINKLPECIGFIMDGNRRFAKERGEPSFFGHEVGLKHFHEVCNWVKEKNIKHTVFYAFSTENWKRDKEEVEGLMRLFLELSEQLIANFKTDEEKMRVRFIGQRGDFSEELQAVMNRLENESSQFDTNLTIWIALSYGGRAEILAGVNEAVRLGKEVDEASFKNLLWTAQMPDPDLIIRTGGDNRTSNFLTWGSVYSEWFFVKSYWPAFTKDEFTSILLEYGKRERRHGK